MSANRPRLTEAEGPPELDPALAGAYQRWRANGPTPLGGCLHMAPRSASHRLATHLRRPRTPSGWWSRPTHLEGQRAALTTAALGGGRLRAASDACQGGTAGPRRRASLCRPDVEWRGVSASMYLSIYLSICQGGTCGVQAAVTQATLLWSPEGRRAHSGRAPRAAVKADPPLRGRRVWRGWPASALPLPGRRVWPY